MNCKREAVIAILINNLWNHILELDHFGTITSILWSCKKTDCRIRFNFILYCRISVDNSWSERPGARHIMWFLATFTPFCYSRFASYTLLSWNCKSPSICQWVRSAEHSDLLCVLTAHVRNWAFSSTLFTRFAKKKLASFFYF